MDTVRVIQVVETTLTRRGRGIVGDPIRVIRQYWSLEGELLAEVDTWADTPEAQRVDSRIGTTEPRELRDRQP